MRLFCLYFLVLAVSVLTNCAIRSPFTSPEDRPFVKNVEMISEVSLRSSTGMLGSSFEIMLREDGTARLECDFSELNTEEKPLYPNAQPICGEMYRRFAADFVESGTQDYEKRLKGVFTSKVPVERYRELAGRAIKNDFLSMRERDAFNGRTDSPVDRTAIVYRGKLKEVFGDGGEDDKLAEIKRMIYAIAKETDWTSERK